MKVEIISIGNELLMSDILDTGTTYVSRSLRDAGIHLSCKVTVGDDLETIVDVLQVALTRADVVMTIGSFGKRKNQILQAVANVTGRELSAESAALAGATQLGAGLNPHGLLIEEANSTLICLPGKRRDLAYILEAEVLPLLKQRQESQKVSGWVILRTVDIMESSLKEQMSSLALSPMHRISYESFAGETTIRLSAEAATREQLERELQEMKETVTGLLGDRVYGGGAQRLEDVVLAALSQSDKKVAVAECHTGGILMQAFANSHLPSEPFVAKPETGCEDFIEYLSMEKPLHQQELTRWCQETTEQLMAAAEADLGLLVYKNLTQGGVQIFVTLASPHGVSVTQRSFGGHPDNIDEWAKTLGLAHLRRWLLVHR